MQDRCKCRSIRHFLRRAPAIHSLIYTFYRRDPGPDIESPNVSDDNPDILHRVRLVRQCSDVDLPAQSLGTPQCACRTHSLDSSERDTYAGVCRGQAHDDRLLALVTGPGRAGTEEGEERLDDLKRRYLRSIKVGEVRVAERDMLEGRVRSRCGHRECEKRDDRVDVWDRGGRCEGIPCGVDGEFAR